MLDAHDLIHQAPAESHAWKLQPSIRQSPCQFVNANQKKKLLWPYRCRRREGRALACSGLRPGRPVGHTFRLPRVRSNAMSTAAAS